MTERLPLQWKELCAAWAQLPLSKRVLRCFHVNDLRTLDEVRAFGRMKLQRTRGVGGRTIDDICALAGLPAAQTHGPHPPVLPVNSERADLIAAFVKNNQAILTLSDVASCSQIVAGIRAEASAA